MCLLEFVGTLTAEMRCKPRPITISGAGVGGLTLAVGLQQRGFEVVVLERQADIRDGGAGISLWPNALAALDALELGDAVRRLGQGISAGGLRKLDGQLGARFSAKSFESALGEGLVCVDRGDLIRSLAGLLKPGTVRTGHAVTGYERQDDAVLVRVEGRGGVEANALVGADGINSPVASQLDGCLQVAYSGYTAWRGLCEMEFDPDRDQVRVCLAGGREFGWMPVGAGRLYWFATAWLRAGYDPPAGDKAFLAEMFARWPAPIPDLLDQTPAGQLIRNDIVDRVGLGRWCDGPVTVVGDAAHPMRPHLGQGGCQAIEDAAALVACCSDGPVNCADAFARYERARRQRAQRIVRRSRRAGFTRPPGLVTAIFDRFANSAPAIPIGVALHAIRPIAGYHAGSVAARPPKSGRR